MKRLINFIKRNSKKLALMSVIPVALIGVGVASSWGPERQTFSINAPADYVTFNSITDNPHVGDERNFVVVKDAANQSGGGWSDNLNVERGKEYLVRVYVHNNAASNLNLVANNTNVKVSVPNTTGTRVPITGWVSASNARPTEVHDDIVLNGSEQFNLAYVAGSARIYNNGYAAGGSGQSLPDSIVTSAGAAIGYAQAGDGKVPGCFEFVSYVTFKVKPQFAPQPNFEIAKTVTKFGETNFVENVNVKPGDKVEFKLKYTNTGETQQDNVVIKDVLPVGMNYVNGTTRLFNSVNPNGKALSDNVTKATGVNIGSHAAKASSSVVFVAQVKANADLPACGVNILQNIGRAETDNGSKQDPATVTVTKTCEKPEPKFVCDSVIAKPIGDTKDRKYQITVNTTVKNATVNKYVYDFGDASPPLSSTNKVATHQYKAAGNYTVGVTVIFNVDSAQKSVKCQTTLKITSNPCVLNPSITKDDPRCKPCPYNTSILVGNPSCKPDVPPSVTPNVPSITTLPSTGAGAMVAGAFGTSALGYGLLAFAQSRRALKNIK